MCLPSCLRFGGWRNCISDETRSVTWPCPKTQTQNSSSCSSTNAKEYKSLTNFFAKFPNLKSIALNGSGLDQIPESVFSLKALKQLSLEDNPLKRIPDEIGLLAMLTQLDVSNCQLKTLPKALASATGLRDVMARTTLDSFGLRLSGNPFVDKDLRKIAKLKNPARTLEALDWATANGD